MSTNGALTKQPAESRLYTMDFSNLLGSGESVAGNPTMFQELEGGTATTDLTFSDHAYTASLAQVRIEGGTDQTLYKVTYRVTTDLLNTLEAEGWLWVEDL
jgi:hypothetical protein